MRFHYVFYSYEEFGRGYIGSRSCKANPQLGNDAGYFGSFRDETFHPTEKIILGYYETAKESLEAENKLMEFYNVASNPHFANKQISPYDYKGTGNGMLGKTQSEETKQLIREKATGRLHSEETKRRMSETRRGKPSGADGANISKALKGREITWGDKISAAKRGKMTEEHKQKLAEARRQAIARKKLNKNKPEE